MILYKEISIELSQLSSAMTSVQILHLKRKKIEYSERLNLFLEKINKIALKKYAIYQELDLLFVENEERYNKGLLLWLQAINTAFDQISQKFKDEASEEEIISNHSKFRAAYYTVYRKFQELKKLTSTEQKKIALDTISPEECILYCAYHLYQIKYKILERQAILKGGLKYFYLASDNDNLIWSSMLQENINLVDYFLHNNDLHFKQSIKSKIIEEALTILDSNLASYQRNGGSLIDWWEHTQQLLPKYKFPAQKKALMMWMKSKNLSFKSKKTDTQTNIESNLPIKSENLKSTQENPFKDKNTELKGIFNESGNGFTTCLDLFEELDITINGQSNIKHGRAGNLVGLIMALKKTPGMLKTDFTENQLLKYFNQYFETSFITINKRTKGYKENLDLALKYIKRSFKR